MANNLPPPKIAIFERVIWSAGRQKSLSVRSGGAGFDRFRHGARNCPFDTSHLESPVTMPPAPAVQQRRTGVATPNLRSGQRTDSALRGLRWLTAIVEYYQRPRHSRSPECTTPRLVSD